ncbi:MAG: hypothetical protein Q7R67_00990 [bacterium]|nr:hypothetical protein [bacterium]
MKAERGEAKPAAFGGGWELEHYRSVGGGLEIPGTRSVHLNAKIKNF